MWANRWLVKFNPTKTKLMNITFKKDCNFEDFPLSFYNTQLYEVNEHKHLGIEFRSDLKWTCHINKILASVSKLGDVLQKLKYKLDRKTLEHIYFTIVRPKLEYGSIIWDD